VSRGRGNQNDGVIVMIDGLPADGFERFLEAAFLDRDQRGIRADVAKSVDARRVVAEVRRLPELAGLELRASIDEDLEV